MGSYSSGHFIWSLVEKDKRQTMSKEVKIAELVSSVMPVLQVIMKNSTVTKK